MAFSAHKVRLDGIYGLRVTYSSLVSCAEALGRRLDMSPSTPKFRLSWTTCLVLRVARVGEHDFESAVTL